MTNLKCPTCKAVTDAVFHARDKHRRKPKDGELALCSLCGEINRFKVGKDHEITLVSVAPYELELLKRNFPAQHELIVKASQAFKLSRAQ